VSYGIVLLRVVLGAIMAAHGAQKLFGWFGGPGPRGTAGFVAQLRYRGGLATAAALGLAELGGGALLALGLITPVGAFFVAAVMVNAVATVHWRNGFFAGSGGWEFNLLIWGAAVALAGTGGERFSLDRVIGWEGSLGGVWWLVGAGGASLLVSALVLLLGREPERPAVQPESGERERDLSRA
jgi:putative oxidoreductase